MNEKEKWMQRAIEVAKLGSGYVHPNPLVGCVIVKDGNIISEGYHQYYGGAHAEVNAVKKLEKQGFQEWDKVEMYVTLEPCSHFGKTPPCTNLILEKGIKKVFIATVDVNPVVAGKGIEKLKQNDVYVEVGILEQEARELNKRFFMYHLNKRPYIILKWAESKDGFISKINFLSREENIISSDEALKIVHLWRSEEQSILVGYNTVIADNPQLNVRLVKGKNPVKIVLDKNLNLDIEKYQVFKGDEKVIVFNSLNDKEERNIIFKKINWENKVEEILKNLYEVQIVSVLIEGGRKTLQEFLDKKMFDEIRIIKSKEKIFNEGIKTPDLLDDLKCVEKIELEKDMIEVWKKQ
ncbi:MAG TPA: bifunctional diaminohydroxyphosphoribosylaminopyrimidine deaminase/5-amino-6-(5-phosphoribosylamino)uracil reductase RibD [Bacteroidia bacterium]|nr:bifunctional diaminohydroxyphosphoribosylaminopyrimidine deaminase/5-amino-6-(5-phosphoribosylamino)uracil reductase RibD [Bacteroidia bacterium]